ncbi:MAG: DNA-processing protein DprA [Acidimicrobiia bacterium]
MTPVTEPSDELAAATLAALPRITPGRLLALLTHWSTPGAALAAVRAGHAAAALGPAEPRTVARAREWAGAIDATMAALAPMLARRATRVVHIGAPGYPIDEGIEDRPAVLFTEGDRADVLERPRVAVVGTRAATPHGLADARELGAALARAGIVVVSGLAIGIDGAAHEGALDSGGAVLGVVATGLDVVYPRRHGSLYHRVREHGLLVSEQPFGIGPHPARFPVRNRIIASLADVTIVVEATERGGARITARHALEYGRSVLAIPGSRRNPSARGCNELLAEGAQPLLDPADVAVALELSPGSRRHPARGRDGLPGATAEERAVFRALGGEAATADELVGRTALGPGAVAVAVSGLVRAGRASRAHGLVWPV